MPLKHVLSVIGLVNLPGTAKLWAIPHENDSQMQKGEFLVMPLNNVLSAIGLVNHLEPPKLWAIGHGNGHKTQR
jgi:hypothetical protein